MLSILAIFIFLFGNFTQQTSGNGPGPVTFTIDSKLVQYEGQLDQVEIWQNGQKCGKPTSLNGSTQFTVDWKECPEEVKEASDLKHIEIAIQYRIGPEHERMIQRVGANLADCSDDLLQKLFVGGEAKILVSKDGRNNVIEYVEDTNTNTSHGNGPGPVTFTIDHSKLDKSAELVKVEVKRKGKVHQSHTVCVVANASDASISGILEIRLFPNPLGDWGPPAGICPWAGSNFDGCLQQEAVVNKNDIFRDINMND